MAGQGALQLPASMAETGLALQDGVRLVVEPLRLRPIPVASEMVGLSRRLRVLLRVPDVHLLRILVVRTCGGPEVGGGT